MEEIKGTVERIRFSNPENGYTVCYVIPDDDYIDSIRQKVYIDKFVTVVGILPLLYEGERCLFKGKWENNTEFGIQFAVESFEREFPTDSESIYRYLSSGVIKKIGPVIARRIVDRFGDETLNVMENNPMWLCEIKGISRKAAEAIGIDYRAKFELHKVMIYCNSLFGADMAAKICNKYGAVAIQIIENNPYCLCEEFRGISFGVADKIALKHGFRSTSTERLEAGICYYLGYSMSEHGHCYIPKKLFVPLAVTRLFGELDFEETDSMCLKIERSLSDLAVSGKVVQFKIDDTECVALKYLFDCEKYISDKLLLLNEYQHSYRISGVEEEIARLEKENQCVYADEQKRAIKTAVTSGVTVVTGGPGTGKTTVIKAILSIFSSLKISFVLAAPTGRAAKRMSEASGYSAKTIHRLLQPEFSDDGKLRFSKNERDPLSAKAVIIDEMSMVDAVLMKALLAAVRPGTYLVLIGDVDQLPPVGAGKVLDDIISSGAVPVIRLNEIFRQAKESKIVMNAHRINNGEDLCYSNENTDFYFLDCSSEEKIASIIVDMAHKRIPQAFGYDSNEHIQVITPTRKSYLGTKSLNALLQDRFNPKSVRKVEFEFRGVIFREGDRIMQTKNNYDITWIKEDEEGQGIFNGDMGRISRIFLDEEYMEVDFEGRIVEYDFPYLEDIVHSYAITVHKSQGSEYPVVIMPAWSFQPALMNRKLLYTAVTRAKKMVVLIGKQHNLKKMINNKQVSKRYTALANILRDEIIL